MMRIVDKLPEGVEMSQYLREKVKARREGSRKIAYFEVMSVGLRYYIPITADLWKALNLKVVLKDFDPKEEWYCNDELSHALSTLVSAVYLQTRDNILGGIAQEVKAEMHSRIDAMINKPLFAQLEQKADQRMLALPAASQGACQCEFGVEVEKDCTPSRGANDCGVYHRCRKWANEREKKP